MRLSNRTVNTLAEMICGGEGGVQGSQGWTNFPYRTSSELTEFFSNAGLDDVHDGSTRTWWVLQVLKRLNKLSVDDDSPPSGPLASVIRELLDPAEFKHDSDRRAAAIDNVNSVLDRDGLGVYLDHRSRCCLRKTSAGHAPTFTSLERALAGRDMGSVHDEIHRLHAALESDPPAAATAACSLLEAIFKVYIEEHGLTPPTKLTVKPLWNAVSRDLGFDPSKIVDDDLKRILTGMTSIVDGIAALRTHAGSAHGRGTTRYRLKPRHARLAVHAVQTLATFVAESWEERRDSGA